ncbi:MAG: homoserine kinase [Acidobacteriota bacterium]|nr:homoserine kinase [Acidobacteriota bacterium]
MTTAPQLSRTQIRAFAPATVANVGSGFDVFGFALHQPGDEVFLKIIPRPGVTITRITGDEGKLPVDPTKNTAGVSLLAMLDKLNADFGIEMELHKKMAIGSGLGSSAASSVAGVFGLNAMLRHPMTKDELLPFAIAGEKITSGESVHLDNIAACLYGGFILVRSRQPIDIVSIPAPRQLVCAVLHPQIEIRTELSRKMLLQHVPLQKAVTQWGNVAGTVCALFNGDFELLKRSFEDVIVTPDRAILIPRYDAVRDAALAAGAIGCSISGSGPSIFALSDSLAGAEAVGQAMKRSLSDLNIQLDLYISEINREGPKILE